MSEKDQQQPLTGCVCMEPGHCPRHHVTKGKTWHKLCQTRPDYYEAWEEFRGPGQTQLHGPPRPQPVPAVEQPEAFPCVHRGRLERIGQCDLCGFKGQPFNVHLCGIHGECSINRKHSQVRSCVACGDRKEPEAESPRPVIPPRPKETRASPSVGFLKDSHGRPANCWHDAFRGGTAFLLGGGPSLRSMDLSPLRQVGILTAAMNNVATIFRPQLWFTVDPPDRFHDSIFLDPGIIKFVMAKCAAVKLWTWDSDEEKHVATSREARSCPNIWFYEHDKNYDPATFLIQPYPTWGPKGERSVMLLAVRMLYWLGIRRVYLLGCDFKMKPHKPYAFDETPENAVADHNNRLFRTLARMFAEMREHFELHGFQILNCTPGSKLDAFPHVPFEAAIEDARSQIPAEIITRGLYRPVEPKDR